MPDLSKIATEELERRARADDVVFKAVLDLSHRLFDELRGAETLLGGIGRIGDTE